MNNIPIPYYFEKDYPLNISIQTAQSLFLNEIQNTLQTSRIQRPLLEVNVMLEDKYRQRNLKRTFQAKLTVGLMHVLPQEYTEIDLAILRNYNIRKIVNNTKHTIICKSYSAETSFEGREMLKVELIHWIEKEDLSEEYQIWVTLEKIDWGTDGIFRCINLSKTCTTSKNDYQKYGLRYNTNLRYYNLICK